MTNKEQLLKKISEKILAIERAKNFYNEREMTDDVSELENASEQLIQLQKRIEKPSGIISIAPDFAKEIYWENQYNEIEELVRINLIKYSMIKARGAIEQGKSVVFKDKGKKADYLNIEKYSKGLTETVFEKTGKNIFTNNEGLKYEDNQLGEVIEMNELASTTKKEWYKL